MTSEEDFSSTTILDHFRKIETNDEPNIIFITEEGGEVGRLAWKNGGLNFKGNASEFAKIFFEFFLKNAADKYVKKQLIEMERQINKVQSPIGKG